MVDQIAFEKYTSLFMERLMSDRDTLRAKWILNLRNGTYQQGRDALKRKDGTFCCLGVGEDTVNPHRWEDPGDDTSKLCYGIRQVTSYTRPGSTEPETWFQSALMTPETQEALGLASNSGVLNLRLIPAELRQRIEKFVADRNGTKEWDLGIRPTLMGLNDLEVSFLMIAEIIETGAAWKENMHK